jgi:C_GCAxxG_C_C family probable redox protein
MVKRKEAERLAEKVVTLMRDKKNNCAEAMIKVMTERFGFDPALGKIGTAFGGGISENADLCGFLTGGLIVIGMKFGRTEPGDQETKKKCYAIGSRYYTWFLKKFGRCTDLKGNPRVAPYDDCYAAAGEVVPFLLALIERNERK